MLTEKDKRVLAQVRRATDDYTVRRRRKEIHEKQRSLEDYDV